MARLRYFQHHLSENSVFFFLRYQTTLVNYAAFSLIVPKTCFCLLATKLGCLELYVACTLLKYGVLSFIAPKSCFTLFAVKLGIFQQFEREVDFFLIFSEWLWFLLDGTQNNVLACFLAKLRCFKHHFSKNNLYHFFLHEIRVWRSNLSKTPFGFFAANLSWFELCVTKARVFPFLCLK